MKKYTFFFLIFTLFLINIRYSYVFAATPAPTPTVCQGNSCFKNIAYAVRASCAKAQNTVKDIMYSAKIHNATVINYAVGDTETGWNNFMNLLTETKNTNMEIWISLRPPSEAGNSYPYASDYIKWASEIAKLSQTYPNLKALAIDDFTQNYETFSPSYLEQMRTASDNFNPNLKFIPVIYYRTSLVGQANRNNFLERQSYFDAVQFYYRAESSVGDTPPGHYHFDPFEGSRFMAELNTLKSVFTKDIFIGVYAKRHSVIGFQSAAFVKGLTDLAGENADGVVDYWMDAHRCIETDGTITTKVNRAKLDVIKNFFGRKICNNNTTCEIGENHTNCPNDCEDSFEQFPSSSTASSEFNSAWTAANVSSYPEHEDCKVNSQVDFPSPNFRCGGADITIRVSEWKKKTIEETATITLTYPAPVTASSIEITGNELAIIKIEAKKPNNQWQTVWTGSASDDYCLLKINLTTKVFTNTLRITTGAGKWSSIAAVKMISPLPGDLDADGDVDNHDFDTMVADFGKTGSPGFIPADIDKNGKVDIFDYNVLVGNFGSP